MKPITFLYTVNEKFPRKVSLLACNIKHIPTEMKLALKKLSFFTSRFIRFKVDFSESFSFIVLKGFPLFYNVWKNMVSFYLFSCPSFLWILNIYRVCLTSNIVMQHQLKNYVSISVRIGKKWKWGQNLNMFWF